MRFVGLPCGKVGLMPNTKVCPQCTDELPLDSFTPRGSKVSSWCRPCSRSYARSRRQEPDYKERRLFSGWKYELKAKYNITPDDYDALLASQSGVCAICLGPQEGQKRFAVDHDHASGRVRGLLCTRCNRSLGGFGDDPATLSRAAEYLRSS